MLEVLELRAVDFELPRIMLRQPRNKKPGSKDNGGSKHQDIFVDFSKLRELTLIDSGPDDSLSQLEGIIRRSPRLRKLNWQTRWYCWFPIRSSVEVQDYLVLLKTANRLQRLNMPLLMLNMHTIDTLTQRHSQTIREIDLRDLRDEQMPLWIQDVLSTCPMLTKVTCQALSAQNVIEGVPFWVCRDRLEEFCICINMHPAMNNPSRIEISEEEERDQCWAVYSQLGRLRALRVLDLRYQPSRLGMGFIFRHRIRMLPTTTTMGLCQLSKLELLECFQFNGHQDMTKVDVMWMLEHWTSLKLIEGGKLSTGGSRFLDREDPFDAGLARIFNAYGVQTPMSQYPKEYEAYDWNNENWPENEPQQEPYSINDEANIYEELDIDILG
ncbi:hypothetical protein BGZ65_005289 [Modicella reniformis]|uniref:Uncharacterized protein n=1 Tax=Modicella reniformis TaxID=1440133 RepID=A0A9P6M2T8_9FUNG|nr:hypothetical protein BGZ65_005289 [Modicella reniformis]